MCCSCMCHSLTVRMGEKILSENVGSAQDWIQFFYLLCTTNVLHTCID